jgi:hypothetical protein
MVKKGFKCVTVPEWLYEQLKAEASSRNISIPKLIAEMLHSRSQTIHEPHNCQASDKNLTREGMETVGFHSDLRSSGVGLRGFESHPPHKK